jgi:hypothetical protein
MSVNTHMHTRSITRPAQRVSPLPDIVGLGGAVAGIGGGIAMAFVGFLLALARGDDIWFAPKQIAAAFVATPASNQPGFVFWPVVAGSLAHLVISIVLGAIFGIVTRRFLKLPMNFGIPVVAGLIYGLIIWLIAYFVFFPIMNPTLLQTYAPDFIIQNMTYGVVLGALYSLLRP